MSATAESIPLQQLQSSANEYLALEFFVNAILSHVRTAQQVQVIGVTGGGLGPIGTVDVQPLVFQINGAGQGQPHGVVYGRPYIRWQGGTSALILDPSVNDIGLLVCCDRDISNVVATLAGALPASLRRFNFADGIYVGCSLSKTTPTDYVWIKPNSAGISIVTQGTLTAQAEQINATGAINANGATINTSGDLAAPQLAAGNGASGSFTGDSGAVTVTVVDGIITNIS
jgi:hypothetical protein